MREDTWGGDLPVGEAKAISHQLFKGNDYWFCMGSDVKGAKISVHVYDGDGTLVEDADKLAERKAGWRVRRGVDPAARRPAPIF